MKKFNFLKFIIYFIVSFMFFLTFSLSAQAAAVPIDMPILPYVPPNDSQIMDLISNAYGVTAPDIEDAEEKISAYMKIYQGILGASYETFKEKLDTIINNAKTSGKITIDNEASSIIQQALNQAITQGYELDSTQAITNFAEIKAKILQDFSGTFITQLSQSKWEQLENACIQKFGNSPYTCMAWLAYGAGDTYLFIGFYPSNQNLTLRQNYTYNNYQYSFAWTGNNITYLNVAYKGRNTSTWNRYDNNDPFLNLGGFYSSIGIVKNYGVVANYENVSAQSQSIADALTTQDVVPVTADTNTSDMTGDIVINIPSIIIYPAENVNDLPTTQEQLGVMPTTPDTTAEQLEQIISELRELKTASLGDIPTYSIDLTEYFPFCIPFDIGNILTILIADPEAPSFDWDFPSGYQNGEVQYTTVTIDLSVWDPVAAVLRAGLVLVFIIGLGMVTRAVFLRG